MKRKIIIAFWTLFSIGLVGVILLFVLITQGKFGYMPTFEYLENPQTNLATEVYSSDGELLTTFFLDENRTPIAYKDLPPYLIDALIAREDHRFLDHSGVDGMGLARVAVKTVILQRSGEGGGSTITQQLAKQLFKRDTTEYEWGIVRKMHMATIKFREWVIASRLERQYTKPEIITMYLNMVPFGYNSFGIKSAAMTYFKKSVDSLKIEEAALLVGMLKAPGDYNPVRHYDRAIARRNSVLAKMAEHGYLTEHQADSLMQLREPLNRFERQDHQAGSAAYFREYLRLIMNKKRPRAERYQNRDSFHEDSLQWIENPLFGWCNKNLKPDGSPYNLYTDGLKIYTTIDSRMQRYAEAAMRQHMKSLQTEFFLEKKGNKQAPFSEDLTPEQINAIMLASMRQTERYRVLRTRGLSQDEIIKIFKKPCEMTVFSWNGERDTVMSPWDSIRWHKSFLRASMMAMNPHTGAVKVYVGGIDYKRFKWDGVTLQRRQVGSTFKPFLYTTAFEETNLHLTPCYKVLNVPQSFVVGDSVWSPKSSGRKEYLYKNVTLKWALATSENNVTAWLLKQVSAAAVVEMARKMGVTSRIPAVPSIVLGTPEISLAEMVAAFSVFPNKGVYSTPMYVSRIADKSGNVLQKFGSYKEEAISEQTAYLMINLLEGVVKGGTANRLRSVYGLMNDMGGKTGTTQNHSDGWFIGITPDLVGGVWVGGEDRAIHFDNMRMGQGSAMALPVFGLFLQKVFADKRINLGQQPFERPAGFNVNMDCSVSDEFGSDAIYED